MNLAHSYARAIADAAGKPGADEAKIVANLVAHLREVGRTKLLPGIKRELVALAARRAKLAPSVEVASEKEAGIALAAAAKEGITAERATVNPALIRGWRARGSGTLIDRSAKRALIDLYRSIV